MSYFRRVLAADCLTAQFTSQALRACPALMAVNYTLWLCEMQYGIKYETIRKVYVFISLP
nr:MAG TPA: hypothetical protein [Caudoviricetes sp.]